METTFAKSVNHRGITVGVSLLEKLSKQEERYERGMGRGIKTVYPHMIVSKNKIKYL